ncbi:bifunctional 4-hydroxy-2-oxoglutarate aldolase/2-dehydro-3-deoxy-phosphogluconate aldolase [Candidatus Bathyarchaeota archaeon]|nr:bifunctional 4-hydroxy-2-oxoglutarate aldolase/2-dehydro-3-deoxy-phosphogluconate aldolase [Candidatus Bathyarchaeota archaeon]
MIDELVKDLSRSKLIAVIALEDPNLAVPLANALLDGGVEFIEITFRTAGAARALKALQDAGISIHYGAGTVRTKQQVLDAINAGAEFMVSPGFNGDIMQLAKDTGIPFYPGVDSTLGIEHAMTRGLEILKFFPAEVSGGARWLKAVKGPYPDLSFIPTGGVNMENLEMYLGMSNVIGVGGSFLAPRQLLQDLDFAEITRIAGKASEIVKESIKK